MARYSDVSQPLLYDGVITECDQFIAQKESEMLRKRSSYAFIWAKCSNEDRAAVRLYLANGVVRVLSVEPCKQLYISNDVLLIFARMQS